MKNFFLIVLGGVLGSAISLLVVSHQSPESQTEVVEGSSREPLNSRPEAINEAALLPSSDILSGTQVQTTEQDRSLNVEGKETYNPESFNNALNQDPILQASAGDLPTSKPLSCDPPNPSEEAELIAVGTYQAQVASTDISFEEAANGSPAWRINVNIEDGTTPLWLVLSAFESAIWTFSGDVARVEQAVISTANSGAGTQGLRTDQVTFMGPNCFDKRGGPVYFTKVSGSFRVLGPIEETISHTIENIYADYYVDRVSLPSGEIVATRLSITKYASLAPTNPATLVTAPGAYRPSIPDGDAGLALLIENGNLKNTSYQVYEILEEIEALPRGIQGTFVLGRGMREPKVYDRACLKDWRGKYIAGLEVMCQ